jgi:hypothetical protein
VDRVAPTPTEAPPDEATVDITAPPQPQTAPDAPGDTAIPQQDPIAPPEATTEIVTEATETDTDSLDRAAAAPTVSPRPRTRPERPAPQRADPAPQDGSPDPAPETEQADATPPADVADDVADAVAAALANDLGTSALDGNGTSATALTASEADALRLAIQRCWNIGVLSSEAQQVVITVGFSMTPSARHEQGSIYIAEASGASDMAVQQAFEAARRAIIQCEGDGYGLPPEKYESWQQVEITFNPEGMRLR